MRIDTFQDPFRGRIGEYQFSMAHLEKARLFRTPEDYDYGVNTLALATLVCPVKLLGYTLMDNHLHLLLGAAFPDCRRYIGWVVRRLRLMLRQRHGVSGLLGENAFDVTAVTDDTMYLNELAYILRNVYKARMASPFSFLWNSADVYFNPWREHIRGERLGSLDVARQKQLLQTHVMVPAEWEHLGGRILNRFFVDYAAAEKRVGDSLRLFDRLRLWDLESTMAVSHGLERSIAFTDNELQEKMLAICRNEFHVGSPHQLDRKTLLLLARTLARRFSARKDQVARLTGLDADILDRLL